MWTLEPLVLAHDRGLRFLVIGGHAVSQLGYSRLTFDLDLLVGRDDRDRWLELLRQARYEVFHDGGTFLQLAPSTVGAAWPIDLMLVAEETMAAMVEASQQVDMLGVKVMIPSVHHLLALKLHAMRTGPAERAGKDYQDVVGILRTQKLDPRSPEIEALMKRYGTQSWYERILDSFP